MNTGRIEASKASSSQSFVSIANDLSKKTSAAAERTLKEATPSPSYLYKREETTPLYIPCFEEVLARTDVELKAAQEERRNRQQPSLSEKK